MALAAFGPINEGIELRHVSFLAPFSVADGETRDIRLRIRKEAHRPVFRCSPRNPKVWNSLPAIFHGP